MTSKQKKLYNRLLKRQKKHRAEFKEALDDSKSVHHFIRAMGIITVNELLGKETKAEYQWFERSPIAKVL